MEEVPKLVCYRLICKPVIRLIPGMVFFYAVNQLGKEKPLDMTIPKMSQMWLIGFQSVSVVLAA